jgi:hypothetical protein
LELLIILATTTGRKIIRVGVGKKIDLVSVPELGSVIRTASGETKEILLVSRTRMYDRCHSLE